MQFKVRSEHLELRKTFLEIYFRKVYSSGKEAQYYEFMKDTDNLNSSCKKGSVLKKSLWATKYI